MMHLFYLTSAILKLAESKQDVSTSITNFQVQISSQRNMTDGEIGVFSAEKYFNGGMDEGNATERGGGPIHTKKDDKVYPLSINLKSKSGIRSSRSEASWNSQSVLLPGDQSPIQKNKASGKSFFSTFTWKCSCSGNKSLKINETVAENKRSITNKKILNYRKGPTEAPVQTKMNSDSLNGKEQTKIEETNPSQSFNEASLALDKDDNFAFQISISAAPDLTAEKRYEEILEKGNVWKPLEEFGSPTLRKGDKAMSLDRRLPVFAWNVDPRVEDMPATVSSRGTQDDEESDSSSDLFEIKNFSESAHPSCRGEVSHGIRTGSTTGCSEPSEASVDWSVVTASAMNSPIKSNYKDRTLQALLHPTKSTTKTTTKTPYVIGKEVQSRNPNQGSGCKSERAVKVAKEADRMPEMLKSTKKYPRTGTIITMAKSQTDTRSRNFVFASAQRASHACAVPPWHSVQASQSIYMH